MGVRLEDLPPEMRAKVEAELGMKPSRSRQGKRNYADARPQVTVCLGCDVEFPTFTACERHINRDHGGVGRAAIVLP